MSEQTISLLEIGKPASKLIEAIQSAVGVLYEPTRIRSKAKAEGDAAIILAKAKEEVQDIELRAVRRLRTREVRRQENIEAIADRAFEALPPEVSDEPVDEDWIVNFFEQCQDIANEQMQTLWARLLAGEVARPGSYSPRTLSLVRDLRQADAALFRQFCTFVWSVGGTLSPVVHNHHHHTISKKVNFVGFQHLQTLGLIALSPPLGLIWKFGGEPTQHRVVAEYYGDRYTLTLPDGADGLQLGEANLTVSGQELAAIARGQPDELYKKYVLACWEANGVAGDKHTRLEG